MAAVSRTPILKPASQQQQQRTTPTPYQNPTRRRPLIPSSVVDTENTANVAAATTTATTTTVVRRPKPRDVASRYLSTSSSSSSSSNSASSGSSLPSLRRCPSPIVSRSTAVAGPGPTPRPFVTTRRAQSVERRRVPTPRPIGTDELTTSAAARQLLLSSSSSKRSLSVSFQGESYSMPFSKTKPVSSTPNVRKPTKRPSTPTPVVARTAATPQLPRREGDYLHHQHQHRENVAAAVRPTGLEQVHPWPARSRQVNFNSGSSSVSSVQQLSRSVDLSSERRKLMSGSGGRVVRALQKSLTAGGEGLSRSLSGVELRQQILQSGIDRSIARDTATTTTTTSTTSSRSLSRRLRLVSTSDSTASDSESVCSDSNSGVPNIGRPATGSGGIVVPARYLQQDKRPGSPLTRSNSMGRIPSSKLPLPKKLMCNNSNTNSSTQSPKGAVLSRGLSPLRSGVRPASPGRLLDRPSSSRGMASPSRVRNSASGGGGGVCVNSSNVSSSSTTSVLSFAADMRRATKVGDNRVSDAHSLRVLHNRQLQWRFINARSEDVLSVQKYNAEMILYSTWKTTSDLCTIVFNKRLELALLRLKLKLTSILKEQMPYLEDWSMMDKDHSDSLLGAIESLEASTLRLPVVCGARTDIQSLKDAICSAVDVLHAMAYSICSLLVNVEGVSRLVSEVASLSSSEHALLNECKDILSALAAMQVKDCSLRTHVLQLQREPSPSVAVET